MLKELLSVLEAFELQLWPQGGRTSEVRTKAFFRMPQDTRPDYKGAENTSFHVFTERFEPRPAYQQLLTALANLIARVDINEGTTGACLFLK